jgi:hypothetical protein
MVQCRLIAWARSPAEKFVRLVELPGLPSRKLELRLRTEAPWALRVTRVAVERDDAGILLPVLVEVERLHPCELRALAVKAESEAYLKCGWTRTA